MEEHRKNDQNKGREQQEREQQAIEKLNEKAAYIRDFLATNKGKERKGVSGKEVQSNVTDNERATIKGPHGTIQGYVGIAAAASKNQVILAADACGTDYAGGEFDQITDKRQENLPKVTGREEPLKEALILADTNYFSEDNLQKAQDKGIDVLIPDPHFRTRDPRFDEREGHKTKVKAEEKKKFTIADFRYNEEDNWYACPCGKQLEYSGSTGLRHGRKALRYSAKQGACKGCPLMSRYMSDRGGKEPHKTRYLMEGKEEWLSEKMRRRIDSPAGKDLYSHRMGIIEPCFADME